MNSYDELVTPIIDSVGGVGNIGSATHCSTRLRLKIIDPKKIKKDKLATHKLILGMVERENELQLIIGPDVPIVYTLFKQQMDYLNQNHHTSLGDKPTYSIKNRNDDCRFC